MLINQVLHKATKFGKSFILMKLDTIKAFDYLGWAFLYKVFDHIGIGPYFISMITTINATTSAMLIQGKLTQPFNLERSLQQGCPLFPLLYLIVANVLSWNLSKAALDGLVKGVHIHKTGEYTHGQFVDNTNCIIEAKLE